MKDLAETKLYLNFELKHIPSGILVHQSTFIQKIVESSTWISHIHKKLWFWDLWITRDKDPLSPNDSDEEIFGREFPYHGAMRALVYRANCTRPGMSLAVTLLARYNASLIKWHWVGVKNIFRYLMDTIDLRLFYEKNSRYDHGCILWSWVYISST